MAVAGLAAALLARRALAGRTADLTALAALRAPLNRVAFAARSRLGWTRGAPRLENEQKYELFDYLEAGDRRSAEATEADLRARYALEPLAARSTRRAYRENLYVLSTLDRFAAPPGRGARVTAIDVGSKDFVYAAAIAAFARGGDEARALDVTGVEIDGHVVYRDLYSRADYARAYAAQAGSGVHVRIADFLEFSAAEPAALITMFFPFVTRFALLQWGLPARDYQPAALLAHAASLLAPGGQLVIASHTHEERDALAALMADISRLKPTASSAQDSKLVDYWQDDDDQGEVQTGISVYEIYIIIINGIYVREKRETGGHK